VDRIYPNVLQVRLLFELQNSSTNRFLLFCPIQVLGSVPYNFLHSSWKAF